MIFVRIILLCCLVSLAYGQESSDNVVDVTPILNPLDVRNTHIDPEPKVDLRDIGHGLCQVYEFSLNNSVTSDQVATFILNETPVRYRSALYDEFVKGGTVFVSRLANVGCHINRIRNWFLNHFHRSNNADTMETLSKPFAGLRDSADVAIIHMCMEYIHAHRSSHQDLHLIPETLCQVHDLSMARTVSVKRILATAQNMPAEISEAFVERVLQLGKHGVRKIALVSAVGCKVLPAVVDLDIKTMNEEETDVVAASAVAVHKSLIGTAGVGICAVREIMNQANITHEQVAEFILSKTPLRYRTKLYEEFVKGGTTFAARVANVGCSMVQIKSVLSRMWPFRRFFQLLITLSKPFAGLSQSDEFKLLSEAIEYIEKNRGQKGIMIIPETMCYIRQVSRDRSITKEAVIREIESKMPEELRKSLVDKIFRYGVNSVARIADVACKTLPVHVEVDLKKVGKDGTAVAVVPAFADVEPTADMMDFKVQPANVVTDIVKRETFCELLMLGERMGVTKSGVSQFIRIRFPERWRKHLLGQLFERGLHAVFDVAHKWCFVVDH